MPSENALLAALEISLLLLLLLIPALYTKEEPAYTEENTEPESVHKKHEEYLLHYHAPP